MSRFKREGRTQMQKIGFIYKKKTKYKAKNNQRDMNTTELKTNTD